MSDDGVRNLSSIVDGYFGYWIHAFARVFGLVYVAVAVDLAVFLRSTFFWVD